VDGAQTSIEGILVMADKKLTVAEFEALVNEIKGDCGKCKMDCRDRLRWMDSLIESLRYQLAKALTMNRVLLKATNLVADDDNLDREIKRLTAKILKKEAKKEGPQQNDKNRETLSNWQ
jgi:hypothetical protein